MVLFLPKIMQKLTVYINFKNTGVHIVLKTLTFVLNMTHHGQSYNLIVVYASPASDTNLEYHNE